MLNYLQPIQPHNYLMVVQKVVSASEAQIDALYANFYKQYLQKVQKQQKEAEQKGQKANIVSMPNQDEFRTNNFKNESQANKTNQVSFF